MVQLILLTANLAFIGIMLAALFAMKTYGWLAIISLGLLSASAHIAYRIKQGHWCA